MSHPSQQGVWVDLRDGTVNQMQPHEMPPPSEDMGPGSRFQPTMTSLDFNGHVRLFDRNRMDHDGILLDSYEPLVLSKNDADRFRARLSALHGLAMGLEFLAVQFRQVCSHTPATKHDISISYPIPVASNIFRWFSVSAWDFIHGIGTLAEDAGVLNGRDGATYAKDVAGVIKTFRDKFGAHAAALTYNRHDNMADRQLSVIAGTCTVCGDQVLCPPVHTVRVTEGESTSQNDESFAPWSLDEAWATIYARYFSRVAEVRKSRVDTTRIPYGSKDGAVVSINNSAHTHISVRVNGLSL